MEWEKNEDVEGEEKNRKKKTKEDKNKNNLIVEFDPSKVKPNSKATVDRWFSNDLFSEIEKTTSAARSGKAAAEKKITKTTREEAKEEKNMMKKKQKKNDKDDVVVDEDEDDYESLGNKRGGEGKLEKAKEAAKIAKEGELKSKTTG